MSRGPRWGGRKLGAGSRKRKGHTAGRVSVSLTGHRGTELADPKHLASQPDRPSILSLSLSRACGRESHSWVPGLDLRVHATRAPYAWSSFGTKSSSSFSSSMSLESCLSALEMSSSPETTQAVVRHWREGSTFFFFF